MSIQQQRPQQEQSAAVLLTIGMLCFFAYMIWRSFHTELATAYVYLQLFYSYPVYLLKYLFSLAGLKFSFFDIFLQSYIDFCQNHQPTKLIPSCEGDLSKITFSQLSAAAMPWNCIFGGVGLIWIFLGYRNVEENHPGNKFAKTHTLDSFMAEQRQNYSHLKIYYEFNLQKVNSNTGPLMGMKTVQEFAYEYGLIKGSEPRMIKTIDNGVTKTQYDQLERVPVVDRDVLVPILRRQLGSLWVGVDFLTDAEAILLAMYLPRSCSVDPNMHDDEFKQIWKNCISLEEEFWEIASDDILYSDKFKPIGYYSDDSPIYPDGNKSLSVFNIPKLKSIIAKYIDYPFSKELIAKHAYTRTFIIAVVYQARKLGVMAPCQLRWLKFYDREMWALLQNIGRPSFFSENMGAISHYTAESAADTKIEQPHFYVAINGYEHQIKSYLYTEDSLKKYISRHKGSRF